MSGTEIAIEAIENLLLSEDPHNRALARAEIAELAQPEDPELAEALWFAVREYAFESNDADLLVEACSHISAIAIELDDPTSAAETWIV